MSGKEKFTNFVKNYISYAIVGVISIVFLLIDLVAFSMEIDFKTATLKTILYIMIGFTINSLLRYQGVINGRQDKELLLVQEEYDNQLNENIDNNDRLDEWCDLKNEIVRKNLITKHLKYAHLSYEYWVEGKYVIVDRKDRRKYSKKQLKAIKWCDNCEVELYEPSYLTSTMEHEGNKIKTKNVSVGNYLTKSNAKKLASLIVTSVCFGYLSISLAEDTSWANLIFSMVKVVTWVGSGIFAMIQSYLFLTTTYRENISDKCRKLKEFKQYCISHPKETV